MEMALGCAVAEVPKIVPLPAGLKIVQVRRQTD
jgi:hypothetical protein